MISIPRFLLAVAAVALAAPIATALQIVGLTPDNRLVTFDAARPKIANRVAATGVEGKLIGIDVRPADGRLYGVDDRGIIYVFEMPRGVATIVARVAQPFAGTPKSVVDFNPQADRLRLINLAGTSLRIVTESGAATVDGRLRYADGDANQSKSPTVTTGAYTNAFAGARGTELFNIDTALDVLVLQSPPNDGVLQTRGKLGVDFSPASAFDITPTADGGNQAYAVSNRTLYRIDLATGRAQRAARISGLDADLIDIAIIHAKR